MASIIRISPTVYGPTAQWLFAASYMVAPGTIWLLQLCCALADLGIVVLLLRMVSLRWVFLYSWTFLMVKEYAFTAHIDVIGAFLLTFTLYLRRHAPLPLPDWALSIIVGVLLAAATGIKLFCLLAVPYLLQNDWRGWISFSLAAIYPRSTVSDSSGVVAPGTHGHGRNLAV